MKNLKIVKTYKSISSFNKDYFTHKVKYTPAPIGSEESLQDGGVVDNFQWINSLGVGIKTNRAATSVEKTDLCK